MKTTIYSGFLLLLISAFIHVNLQSQDEHLENLNYISPVPGSKFIMPGNNIAFRHGDPFDSESLLASLMEVKNERGEILSGSTKLTRDQKTLIFQPEAPFPLGQTISVELKEGLKTFRNVNISPIAFEFTITHQIVQPPVTPLQQEETEFTGEGLTMEPLTGQNGLMENDLPPDYPNIIITGENDFSFDEYYFFSQWEYGTTDGAYSVIMDNTGIPVYFRKSDATHRDFKLQHNGLLSYAYLDGEYKMAVLDSAYMLIDQFQSGNGYVNTDFHEFQLLENGHAFISAVDWQIYAMDTVVPGGLPNAMVCGFIVQELDLDKNVIFQWRSWDHFLVSDAGPYVDLTEYLVDYVHGNTIEVESDTSILISCRNMDEITKINRNTGEIIWRFGGKKNQFNVLNDTLGFSMQHDSRRLPNGNITLFDNGRLQPEPQFSSCLEYKLNDETYEAELVRRLRNDPDIYGSAMGNAQWRDDGTVISGWGNGHPGITEFELDGDMVRTIKYTGVSYRAFRFPWKTSYFTLSKDMHDYGYIWKEDEKTKTFKIYNKQDHEILITGYHLHNNKFIVENDFPITIPPGSEENLYVKFSPGMAVGTFYDVLTLNSDIYSDDLVQRIAQQIKLTGASTEGQSVGESGMLEVYASPNPVEDVLHLNFGNKNENLHIRVIDYAGKLQFETRHFENGKCLIDMKTLSQGFYFVELRDPRGMLLKTLKVVKN